jgi:hypothetical protein
MSTPSPASPLELSLKLVANTNAFDGACAALVHDDFEQEIIPKSLGEFIPLRRNKREVLEHTADLHRALKSLNVRIYAFLLRNGMLADRVCARSR